MPFSDLLALRRRRFTELVELDQVIRSRLHSEIGGALLPAIVATPAGDLLDLEATRALEPEPPRRPALPPAPARCWGARANGKAPKNGKRPLNGRGVLFSLLAAEPDRTWTLPEIREIYKTTPAGLRQALGRLVKQGKLDPCGKSVFRVIANGTPKSKKRRGVGKASSAKEPRKQGGQLGPISIQAIAVLASFPEKEWSPGEVAKKIGCTPKEAANALYNAAKADRIKKTGRGAYRSMNQRAS